MIGEIYLEHSIDAGHRIVGHQGKCARPHGHTYRFEVRATGPVHDPGFVADFGDIKDILNQWDHKMLLWDKDPQAVYDRSDVKNPAEAQAVPGIVRVPFNPTAEAMANHLASLIGHTLELDDCQVDVWETPKSMARAYWNRVTHP